MAKFLNKKEQVIDFKLTSYGNYLLSIGDFSPTYYAFLDDNILYDGQYANAYTLKDPKATATVTVDNASLVAYSGAKARVTLTITDGTEVYVEAYTVTTTMSTAGTNQGTFAVDTGSATNTATNMATVLNSHPKLVATSDGSVVTVEQVVGGAPGNTEVVLTNPDGLSKTNFTGGETGIRSTTPTAFERQNDIHERIKDNTSYLEGLVLFEDVEERPFVAGTDVPQLIEAQSKVMENDAWVVVMEGYFQADITPTKIRPRRDAYKMQSTIGDAFLSGDGQKAPAWKAVMLEGEISSSSPIDGKNKVEIPQLNIDLNYIKKIMKNATGSINTNPQNARQIESITTPFIDNNILALQTQNPLIYIEEVNTEILNENFDVEVFEVISGSKENIFERKYFEREKSQVVNQYMISETPLPPVPDYLLNTSSVEYYFDVLTDWQIEKKTACQGAQTFNKQSYYIDLDFDCSTELFSEDLFHDIYGKVTEPEICQT